MSSRIFTNAFSCTSICSAKDDKFMKVWMRPDRSHSKRSDTPGGNLISGSKQSAGRPVVQYSQVPQKTDKQVTT